MPRPKYRHRRIVGPMRPAVLAADILDMLADASDALGIDIDVEGELLNWANSARESVNLVDAKGMPYSMQAIYAAQAIADILARYLKQADKGHLAIVMPQMKSIRGWRSEYSEVVVWVQKRYDENWHAKAKERPCIVVWLGPTFDADRGRIRVSAIK